MSNVEIGKQKAFIVLTAFHILSACIVLTNELLAINNRVPGGNFPIEHKFSWARVLLFCAVAMISAIVVWVFTVRKDLSISLPSFKFVLPVTILLTLISVLVNYPSVSGWCCEVYPTRYFGFPFSYLRGDDLFEEVSLIFKALTIMRSRLYVPYQFFLDLLFWASVAFLVFSLAPFWVQKGKAAKEAENSVRTEKPLLADRIIRLFLAISFGIVAGMIALLPARPAETPLPTVTPFTSQPTYISTITSIPTPRQRLLVLAFASTPTPLPPSSLTPAEGLVSPTPISAAQLIRILTSDDMPVSVAWSPDGMRLISGDGGGGGAGTGLDLGIQIWDWVQGQQVFTASVGDRTISSVDWAPNGKRVALGEAVQVRDSSTGELVAWMDTSAGNCIHVKWSPNGLLVAGGCNDGSVLIWDATTGEQLRRLDGHVYPVTGIAWSPDGLQMASSSHDGTLRIWDVINGIQVNIFRNEADCHGLSPCGIGGIAWSPDGNQIAFGSDNLEVRTWNPINGQLRFIGHHVCDASFSQYQYAISWSPDGRSLVSTNQRCIQIWGLTDGLSSYVLDPGDIDVALGADWSPDGKYLAVAGHSLLDHKGHIWIWSIPGSLANLPSQTYTPQPTLMATPFFTPTRQLPTVTSTFVPEPANPSTVVPTNTGTPRSSKTRINLSDELYLDENSSPDKPGESNYPDYSYFRNDVWGYIYHYRNEEWIIAQPETCIFPSKDINCDSYVEGKLRTYYVQLWKNGKIIYSLDVNYGDQPHTFLRYEDHWIFSFGDDWDNQGWIVQDGIILNDLYDYDTTFSLFLLNDKPFFFFQRGDQFGISFDGEEILLPYSSISYGAICCEGGGAGARNPRASDTKVGFYAKSGDADYQYIEIGLR